MFHVKHSIDIMGGVWYVVYIVGIMWYNVGGSGEF